MPEGLTLALSLAGLAVTLAVAAARPRWLPEAVVAVAAAAGLVAVGAVTVDRAPQAVGHLGPTIGFLAALLLLADGCRRDGLFEALGGLMGRGSRDSPRLLLALVFAVASSVTVVLGLDPTIVLLTPLVLATATRLRISPEPGLHRVAGHFTGIFAARGRGETAGTRTMFIVAGLLSVAFGVVLFAWPGLGAVILALLFGIFAILYGVSHIATGIRLRRTGWGLDSALHDAPA